jgi:glycosyltransferase involved in cell wall biosynthesis
MRVGLNAHLLPHGATYRSAGVAMYIKQLVSRLPSVDPENEYVIFAPPNTTGAGVVPSRWPTSNPLVRILWEQTAESGTARRKHIDVLHATVNISPLLLAPPTVVTIHDLAFLKFPEAFRRPKQVYLRTLVGASIRKAAAIITPSAATRQDIVETYGVSPERVEVIHHGVDEHYRFDPELPRPFEPPFILCVGTIEPRKNIPVLLQAFAELKTMGYPQKLALLGAPGWKYDDVYTTIDHLALSGEVTVRGFVDDLLPWYNHADLFVFPSMYEGFGLPPLEAMACGTPVVLSSAGSLREVAGDAASLVEPSNVGDFLVAMRAVLDDPARRQQMSQAGMAQAGRFSWNDTARRTADVYRVAHERSRAPDRGRG